MKTKIPSKKKTTLIVSIVLLITLVAVRLWLPSLILNNVNKKLQNNIDGYTGSVAEVDLSVLTGSYSLKEVVLRKNHQGTNTPPLFTAESIDLSLEWKALLKGYLASAIEVTKPQLNYIHTRAVETSQLNIDKGWTQVMENLFPLKANLVRVEDGKIFYHDLRSETRVKVNIDSIFIEANNLANVNNDEKMLPSTITASAKLYQGLIKLTMKTNLLHNTPTFDLDAELTTLDLKDLNNFLKAYGNYDVQQGTFSLYTEATTRNNKIEGYVKPIVKDVNVAAWNNPVEKTNDTEAIIGFASWAFKTQPVNQVATLLEFEGSIRNPDIGIWEIISETLQNAFLEALIPSIENSVSVTRHAASATSSRVINTSKKESQPEDKKEGFFKRLFKNKEERQQKKDEKRKRKAE